MNRPYAKDEVLRTSTRTNIVIVHGNAFFINSDLDIDKSILFIDGQYYLSEVGLMTKINPLSHIENINEENDLNCYFIYSKNLGNAIYINEFVDGKKLHVLVYFNEICKLYQKNSRIFKLGDRLIKPFCDEYGNVIVINDLGEVVPHHLIECPGESYTCVIDNDRMRLDIKQIYLFTLGCVFEAEYMAKSRNTKAAPRLDELSAD